MISGRTRWAALLGNPVAQALTPQLLNAELAREPVDGVVIAVQVRSGGLADVVRALRAMDNLCGAVVTMPCKRDVVPLLDEYSASVAAAGACNIVHRGPGGQLTGHMTDGEAMSQAIEAAGVSVSGRDVLLIGAGGVATAIALDLAARGAASITIQARTPRSAAALVDRVSRVTPGVARAARASRRHDLIINATPLGMRAGDPPPAEPAALAGATLVADAAIAPGPTPLLSMARAAGCRVVSGDQMLTAQIKRMAQIIFGDTAPVNATE